MRSTLVDMDNAPTTLPNGTLVAWQTAGRYAVSTNIGEIVGFCASGRDISELVLMHGRPSQYQTEGIRMAATSGDRYLVKVYRKIREAYAVPDPMHPETAVAQVKDSLRRPRFLGPKATMIEMWAAMPKMQAKVAEFRDAYLEMLAMKESPKPRKEAELATLRQIEKSMAANPELRAAADASAKVTADAIDRDVLAKVVFGGSQVGKTPAAKEYLERLVKEGRVIVREATEEERALMAAATQPGGVAPGVHHEVVEAGKDLTDLSGFAERVEKHSSALDATAAKIAAVPMDASASGDFGPSLVQSPEHAAAQAAENARAIAQETAMPTADHMQIALACAEMSKRGLSLTAVQGWKKCGGCGVWYDPQGPNSPHHALAAQWAPCVKKDGDK